MSVLPIADQDIWIWPFEELVAANEAVKRTSRTDIITLTQLAGAGRKVVKQVRLLGAMGSAYVRTARNGKRYIIFKGNPAFRPNLAGTRYARDNPKVSCFVVGTKEIIEDTAKGLKIAVFAFVALDVMEECLSDRFSMASLGVSIVSDVMQATLGAGASVVVGAITVSAGFPVVVTFVLAVGFGVFAGIELSNLDRRYLLTERARKIMINLENTEGSWVYRAERALRGATDSAGRWVRLAGDGVGHVWAEL